MCVKKTLKKEDVVAAHNLAVLTWDITQIWVKKKETSIWIPIMETQRVCAKVKIRKSNNKKIYLFNWNFNKIKFKHNLQKDLFIKELI